MEYLVAKLKRIEKAIESYKGDDSIYARRKVLKLNELASKVEESIRDVRNDA